MWFYPKIHAVVTV